MEKLLIINADDLGMATGVTDAIIDSHNRGIVTSTTLMTNMPDAERAAALAQQTPTLGVGVHLNLTQGRPLSDPELIPDLVDESGCFHPHRVQAKRLWRGKDIEDQVHKEFVTQIRRALDFGLVPTHCDSHHGIHRMPLARNALIRAIPLLPIPRVRYQMGYEWLQNSPALSERVHCTIQRAKKLHKIFAHRHNRSLYRRAGIRTNDQKLDFRHLIGAPADPKSAFLMALECLPPGVTELVFHPSRPDESLQEMQSTTAIRRVDTQLASDPDIKNKITELGIRLGSFADI